MQPTESVFTRLPRLAAQAGALNLAQGLFDHQPLPQVVHELQCAATDATHQYSPSDGLPSLREQIGVLTATWDGVSLDPDHDIIVTAGAAEAISLTMAALCRAPGDEVVLIEPAYEQYTPAVELAGGTVRRVQLSGMQGRLQRDHLRNVASERTVAVVVNTPWNPLGRQLADDEWDALAELANDTGAMIVSDEAYEHCPIGKDRHRGVFASTVPALHAVKVGSFSKVLAATGWRVGYVAGPAEVMRRIRRRHQFGSFCTNSIAQLAVSRILEERFDECRSQLSAQLRQGVGQFIDGLAQVGLHAQTPDFGFYVNVDVGTPAEAWVLDMLADGGVAGLPVAAFCGPDPGPWDTVVRFALCKQQSTLDEAITRLQRRLS